MVKIIMLILVGGVIVYLLRLNKESDDGDKARFTEYEDEKDENKNNEK